MIKEHYEILEGWVKEHVAKDCIPPIVGPITKGAIESSSLSIVKDYEGNTFFTQGNRRISPKLRPGNTIIF